MSSSNIRSKKISELTKSIESLKKEIEEKTKSAEKELAEQELLKQELSEKVSEKVSEEKSEEASNELAGELAGELADELADERTSELSDEIFDELPDQIEEGTELEEIIEKTVEENEINKELNKKELHERKFWGDNESDLHYLYPSLNDPEFNLKIAEKKEFNDTRYNGDIEEVNKQAKKLCDSDFELSPHQQFVKNFLSFQTPYNSLLLYHGLGSGKTCSAIGVAEEMREYNNQINASQRIIVVASPNVQSNFKLQLFDESKLKLVDGIWTINSCTGTKLLQEINPMNTHGISKDRIILQMKRLINRSYLFLGYTEFANRIQKKSDIDEELVKDKGLVIKNKLRKYFNNRMIIIDEVHNIRITDDNKRKRVAKELYKLITNVDNMRLLFLSATPLYNNYKEIIWLINLMNLNDGRSTIQVKDVFNDKGDFKVDDEGREVGKELLERKAVGYISFVRGDNPYTFPYRIWPKEFAPEKTLENMIANEDIIYPERQLNGKEISKSLSHISLYITDLGEYQERGYKYILDKLTPADRDAMEISSSLGFKQLQRPLEALNMIYPNTNFDESTEESRFDNKELIGATGLANTMTFTVSLSPPSKTNFKYKPEIEEKYGRIFSRDNIGNYSGKIKEICDNIMNSEGVILIYSQYLDGGLVPVALALEEMGIKRHGTHKSLFKTPPVANLDLKTLPYTNTTSRDSISAKYIMITGFKPLSPNNVEDLKAATHKNNVDGHKVKVILISQAGSEGLDFKFIRQVHILEPWYNMSRIEQIIGRAVRNCSHKDLPFEKRNVEIFLYGSLLEDNTEEAADLYVYRLAELKAIQIGKINRILKEVSIDCLLNSDQLNFTAEKMQKNVVQILSNRNQIDYQVGDKPYSVQCDYMENCVYQCKPVDNIGSVNKLSYTESFINMNTEKIIHRIRQIFKENYFYKKNELMKHITANKPYPEIQIYAALNELLTNKNELLVDKYGRIGNLVNLGEYYLFQPNELTDENISLYDRSVPIPYKRNSVTIETEKEMSPKQLKDLAVDDVVKDIATQEANLPIIADGDKSQQELTAIENTQKKLSKLLIKKPEALLPENHRGKAIIKAMVKDYNTANDAHTIARGETNWYKFASVVLNNLENDDDYKYEKAILDELLISHIIEMLLYRDVLNLINYIYAKPELDDFEQKIKNYFEYRELKVKKTTGLLLQKWKDGKPSRQFMVLHNKVWTEAQPEDEEDLLPIIKEMIIPLAGDNINNMFGFVTNFKNEAMIFKYKENIPNKSTRGAICNQASKPDIMELVNKIIGKKKYTEKNTKGVKPPISRSYLCILQEFLLRLNNYDKKNGKIWFLDPPQSVLINVEKK